MFLFIALLVPLAYTTGPVLAQAPHGVTCNATTPCPSDYPCCSEYGFCGDDYFCLGGCDPISSHSLDSCKPSPICESFNFTLSDTSRILTNSTHFNGNASKYDWVVDQGSIFNVTSDGEAAIALTLTEKGGGTLLSSTRYVHYGRITARLKTGRWAGVVTAFITMSSVKDEIDWEFPGNGTTEGQTNFFWQGIIPEKTNGVTETDLTDTFSNWHDFTIDWKPDTLTFLVNGNITRTIKVSDLIDTATGVVHYPNTPSRIQLSLWPAGIASEPQGTVQWAGGMINWNDPDYLSAGHFYALFHSVSVQCNDSAHNSSVTSYVYGPNSTLDTPSITFSNASTLINRVGTSKLSNVKGIHATLLAAFFTLALVYLV